MMSNSPSSKNQQKPDQSQQARISPQDIKAEVLKRLSRRNWLRDAAMAATGAVILPSFLSSCTKEQWALVKSNVPGGGLGSELSLTPAQLRHAAENLRSLGNLLRDLYVQTSSYDTTVLFLLNDTSNTNWQYFILDIFINVAYGLGAVVGLLGVELFGALRAFGSFLDVLKIWKISTAPERPKSLSDFFQQYQQGHRAMQYAIEEKIAELTNPANNYANLKAAWAKPIEYNGKTYTLSNLAESTFPNAITNGDTYRKNV